MKEKKVSKIPEKERRGILVKRTERKPLVSEEMSTEEKNERFYEALRRLTKRR